MKMNEDFLAAMHEATRLLQTAGPLEATAAIQRALGGAMPTVQQQARAPEDYAAVLDALAGASLIQPDAFQIFKAKRNPEPGTAAPSVEVEDSGHVLVRSFSGPAGTPETSKPKKWCVPNNLRRAMILAKQPAIVADWSWMIICM